MKGPKEEYVVGARLGWHSVENGKRRGSPVQSIAGIEQIRFSPFNHADGYCYAQRLRQVHSYRGLLDAQ